MTKLYSKLARVYHEMYQTIFNYEEEFQNYYNILDKEKCNKILEIGCGSGNLAPYFLKAGFNYTGLDISEEMLVIAKEVAPEAKFIKGDMRNLQIKEDFEAVLITGRCFSYMTKNSDVINTLKSVHKILKKDGILIFDNFNAEIIFSDFKEEMVVTTEYKDRIYKRISKNTKNLKTGWTWNWNATYYVTESGKTKTIKDKTVLRAFTEDELQLFLRMNSFNIKEIVRTDISIIIIAQKIE